MEPEVSIIMPVYNAGKYIKETLDCVLAQSYPYWCCICVDDGSSDNSKDIIQDYSKKDVRILLYSKLNEKSADLARAYGIERTHSKWILYLDADDIIEPTYIEKMLSRQRETNADVVCPTMIFCKWQLEGEIWRLPCLPLHTNNVINGEQAFKYTIGGWKLSAGGMLYNAELNKGLVRGPYICSDEYSSRMILYRAKLVAFSDAVYLYRQNGDSTSRNISPRIFTRVIVDHQLEDFTFEHFPDDELLKRKVHKGAFFNLVYLTYLYYRQKAFIDSSETQNILSIIKNAYNNLDENRLRKYLPYHKILFIHGYAWFTFVSYVYHSVKNINRTQPYIYI